MCEGYEEDLDMYEEAQGPPTRQFDNETLLCPISTLSYLESPPLAGPETPVVDAVDAMIQSGAGPHCRCEPNDEQQQAACNFHQLNKSFKRYIQGVKPTSKSVLDSNVNDSGK